MSKRNSTCLTLRWHADWLMSGIQKIEQLWQPYPEKPPNFNIWGAGCKLITTTGVNERTCCPTQHAQVPMACALVTNETFAHQIVKHPTQTQESRFGGMSYQWESARRNARWQDWR